MATELATAYISLVPSASGIKGNIERELGGAGSKAARSTESAFRRAAGGATGAFKAGLKGVALGVAGVFAAGAVGAKSAISAASDYGESLSKVQQVFGPKQSAEIEAWAKRSADAFGQSSKQALEAAGTYGNLLTSFGLTSDQAGFMSQNLVGLASDLASFNNTSPEEALQALQSGLTGEMEPLKRYGIALDDASLKAKALALGIADGKAQLTPAQKAQAAYALILERSKNAQGDFSRTSGGLANQQRIFAARIDDLKVKIGQALMPALNALLPVLSDMFSRIGPLIDEALPMLRRGFERVSEWWAKNGPAIQATAAAVMNGLVTGFQTIQSAVETAWPTISKIIGDAVNTIKTVVVGVVDVLMVVWDNFGNNILDMVQRIWSPIQLIIKGALEVIRSIIKTVTSLIHGDWQGVWEGLKGTVEGAWKAIQGIIRGAAELLRAAIGIVGEVVGAAWKAIWEGASKWVSDRLADVVGFFSGLPGKITDATKGMFDGIKEAFKAAINWIIGKWNDLSFTVGGGEVFGKKLPSFTLDTPNLPTFHSGGVVPGRAGREVLALVQAGETIRTPGQEAALGRGIVFERGAIDARGVTDPYALAPAVGAEVTWRLSLAGGA